MTATMMPTHRFVTASRNGSLTLKSYLHDRFPIDAEAPPGLNQCPASGGELDVTSSIERDSLAGWGIRVSQTLATAGNPSFEWSVATLGALRKGFSH